MYRKKQEMLEDKGLRVQRMTCKRLFREVEMKRIGFALALLVSTNASAMAQTSVERWECRDYPGSNWNDILVKATVDSGRASGTIAVAGVTWYTDYEVEGFNRRWNFGPKDHPTRYAFVIAPDGIGRYYDFAGESQKAKADAVMECRQQ